MSSGMASYHEKVHENFVNSEERIKRVEAIRKSEMYARYKELERKFADYEEYINLKEKLKLHGRQQDYNFFKDVDPCGIINKT